MQGAGATADFLRRRKRLPPVPASLWCPKSSTQTHTHTHVYLHAYTGDPTATPTAEVVAKAAPSELELLYRK